MIITVSPKKNCHHKGGNFLVLFRKYNIQQNRYHRSRNNTGAAEDQLNKLGRIRKDSCVGTHTIAYTERYRYDGKVPGSQRILRDQLNTADDDRRKHHNCRATQHRLRHDGNQRRQLRAKAAQDQENRSGRKCKAVYDFIKAQVRRDLELK